MTLPLLLAFITVLLLIAYRIADMYLAGHYVCPGCGARSADRHSGDCPWTRRAPVHKPAATEDAD
jgi:hypothetical protein